MSREECQYFDIFFFSFVGRNDITKMMDQPFDFQRVGMGGFMFYPWARNFFSQETEIRLYFGLTRMISIFLFSSNFTQI